MKTILLSLLTSLLLVTTAGAQLTNTRWKSTLDIDGPVNAIFDFKTNTVSLYTVADSIVIETMSFTTDEATVSVLKLSGQSDCDNATVGKYTYKLKGDTLSLTVVADACDDRADVIHASRWVRWRDRAEVNVKPAVLQQYTGVYQTTSGQLITVMLVNDRLYAEGPANKLPRSSLIAQSDTKFFLRVAGIEWDFVKDASGKVVKLISHEAKDYELKKIK